MKTKPVTIIFTLSMPGNNSWNGRWSGDGWRAAVEAKEADTQAARRIMSKSNGFCGYDWMVRSILSDGDIYGPDRPKPELVTAP